VAENKISMISSIPKIGESVHQIAEEKQGKFLAAIT
jgi:hypothetical protein